MTMRLHNLPILLCFLCLCSLAYADTGFGSDRIWLNSGQQGDRLMHKHRPEAASLVYTDPMHKAFALSTAGHYAEAAKLLKDQHSAYACYNRGNALAHINDLNAAVQAYQEALHDNPQFKAARYNLELVKKHLPPPSESKKNRSSQQSASTNAPQKKQSQSQSGTNPKDSKSSAPPNTQPKPQPSTASLTKANHPAPTKALRPLNDQQREEQAWLRSLPNDPGSLLQQKFLLEYQMHHPDPTVQGN